MLVGFIVGLPGDLRLAAGFCRRNPGVDTMPDRRQVGLLQPAERDRDRSPL